MWNTKGDTFKNVHTALFNTAKVYGDQKWQKVLKNIVYYNPNYLEPHNSFVWWTETLTENHPVCCNTQILFSLWNLSISQLIMRHAKSVFGTLK